jgi:hypothetical protein
VRKIVQSEYENQLDLRWSYIAVVGLTLPFSKVLLKLRREPEARGRRER